jgi:hypothetical protein
VGADPINLMKPGRWMAGAKLAEKTGPGASWAKIRKIFLDFIYSISRKYKNIKRFGGEPRSGQHPWGRAAHTGLGA